MRRNAARVLENQSTDASPGQAAVAASARGSMNDERKKKVKGDPGQVRTKPSASRGRIGADVYKRQGLGEVKVGEGVFGLRRAFVLAGAQTLVMSLWKVPDEATRELMRDFYAHLLAGRPRAEALRAAQLALKARDPDPMVWGCLLYTSRCV